jgi:cation diffusion facilitator family transporter
MIYMESEERTRTRSRGRLRAGEKAAGVATGTKLFLAVVKGWVGMFTGSIALLADALNSGVDVIVSSISWASLRLAQRNPDEEFQYGYYKVENLAALVISGFVIYFAITLGIEGWESFSHELEITAPAAALAVAALSAGVCFVLMRYLTAVGRRVNSQSLIALAKDTLADVLSSSIVFLAIVATVYRVPYVEGVVSIAIALLVLKVGLETAKDATFSLLDVSPSKEIEQKIREIAKEVEGVRGVKILKMRKSGPIIMGDISITTMGDLDVARAHAIADEVERRAKEGVDCLEGLDVHIEPCIPKRRRVAIPTLEDRGMISRVSHSLGRAEFIIVVDVGDEKPSVGKTIMNESREEKVLAGLSLSKSLVGEGVSTVITMSIGEVLFHALRDSYIEILQTRGDTVSEVIEALERGELEHISAPTRESGEIAAREKIREMEARPGDR